MHSCPSFVVPFRNIVMNMIKETMEHGKQRVIERMPKSGFSPQVEGTKEEWRLGIPRNIFFSRQVTKYRRFRFSIQENGEISFMRNGKICRMTKFRILRDKDISNFAKLRYFVFLEITKF